MLLKITTPLFLIVPLFLLNPHILNTFFSYCRHK